MKKLLSLSLIFCLIFSSASFAGIKLTDSKTGAAVANSSKQAKQMETAKATTTTNTKSTGTTTSITQTLTTGWIPIGSEYMYMQNGVPTTGWKSINGADYYFNNAGIMVHDNYSPDGYYLGSDGKYSPDEYDDVNVYEPMDEVKTKSKSSLLGNTNTQALLSTNKTSGSNPNNYKYDYSNIWGSSEVHDNSDEISAPEHYEDKDWQIMDLQHQVSSAKLGEQYALAAKDAYAENQRLFMEEEQKKSNFYADMMQTQQQLYKQLLDDAIEGMRRYSDRGDVTNEMIIGSDNADLLTQSNISAVANAEANGTYTGGTSTTNYTSETAKKQQELIANGNKDAGLYSTDYLNKLVQEDKQKEQAQKIADMYHFPSAQQVLNEKNKLTNTQTGVTKAGDKISNSSVINEAQMFKEMDTKIDSAISKYISGINFK